jgi:hypothetical protein
MSIKIINERLSKLPVSKHIIVDDFPNYEVHKIGFESEKRFITVLIKCDNKNDLIFKPGGGKYLSISYDNYCTIKLKSGGVGKNKKFTILTLKTKEKDIENYFIELCLIFIARLGVAPSIEEVKVQFEKLESIFIKLSKTSTKSILGLWGELFLISISKRSEYIINSWHKEANDKFDFNDGTDKLEVKTTTLNRRKHHFEIKQLKKFTNSITVIASIITSETDNGTSIGDLVNRIKQNISNDLYEKLIIKIFDVIGDKINEIEDIRFDYKIAESEIKFYFSEEIPKPEVIPSEVTEVRFQSDLSDLISIPKSKFKGALLKSIKV